MLTIEQENSIKNILMKCNPSLVGIFGSFARNEQNQGSDLDILLDTAQKINLFELIGLEQELTEHLGLKVALVTLRSINEPLKQYIFKDLIRII